MYKETRQNISHPQQRVNLFDTKKKNISVFCPLLNFITIKMKTKSNKKKEIAKVSRLKDFAEEISNLQAALTNLDDK